MKRTIQVERRSEGEFLISLNDETDVHVHSEQELKGELLGQGMQEQFEEVLQHLRTNGKTTLIGSQLSSFYKRVT